jgi:hypothetical protein
MKKYQVVVGNVGHVYEGDNKRDAIANYNMYVAISKTSGCRASGEPVTMFAHGEIVREYFGTIEER